MQTLNEIYVPLPAAGADDRGVAESHDGDCRVATVAEKLSTVLVAAYQESVWCSLRKGCCSSLAV